mmetsp:Transcript_109188/g.250520  ORF Transcript_109188/g.250520 Transcript_109188/m.250520 type:complete len:212 (-) Transcript_109188:471-1106(-)
MASTCSTCCRSVETVSRSSAFRASRAAMWDALAPPSVAAAAPLSSICCIDNTVSCNCCFSSAFSETRPRNLRFQYRPTASTWPLTAVAKASSSSADRKLFSAPDLTTTWVSSRDRALKARTTRAKQSRSITLGQLRSNDLPWLRCKIARQRSVECRSTTGKASENTPACVNAPRPGRPASTYCTCTLLSVTSIRIRPSLDPTSNFDSRAAM